MFCKNCGVYLLEEAVFCPECGTKQESESPVIDVNPSDVTEVKDGTELTDNVGQRQAETGEVSEQQESPVTQGTLLQRNENQQTQIVNSTVFTDKIKYCHNCGAANAEKDAFCYSCGTAFEKADQAANESGTKERLQKFEWKKGYTFGAIGALLIVALFFVVAAFILPGANKKSTIVYIKDNELNIFQKKEPYGVGDEIYEDSDDSHSLYGLRKDWVQFSGNGKYIFYPQGGDDGEYSVYRSKVNDEKGQEVKVDSDIVNYQVIDENKVVYIKDSEERKLYVSDLNDKEKIASDVSWFMMSENAKTVFWYSEDEDNEGSMYMQCLDGKTEKTKIASGIERLYDYTAEFKTIVYEKDENLYLVKDYGEKEKIVSDYWDAYVDLNSSNPGIYYFVEGDSKLGLSDLLEDKYAESDSKMEYPDITDYQTTTVKDSFWGPMESTVTDDVGYQAAIAKYEEKQIRDAIRQELGLDQESAQEQEYVLYYYDIESGKSEIIQDGLYDDFVAALFNEEGVLCYYWYDFEKMEKVSMDSLVSLYKDESGEDIEDQLEEALTDVAEFVVCEGAKQKKLPIDKEEYGINISDIMVNPDTKTLYVVMTQYEEGKDSSVLLDFNYGAESIEQHVMKDDMENISLELLCDAGLYYICDGTLYLNDEKVTDDVYDVNYAYGDKVIAKKDLDDSYNEYTMCLLDGTESEKIAEDVADWTCSEEGTIVFLTDYNFEKYRGDLKMYQNGETQNIDSDVSSIIGFY